ncbi:hypothetical protein OGATHE_006105 [Ogataea polymorpha]|uniref:Uncharacterized protein n=1 Tax=Ogataea polymorpha TaxID=460523 RepID=A0A9P8SY87_9ASCO|nr:hypothetical protein OGATHE_006105 [Ogataea polymorpha]
MASQAGESGYKSKKLSPESQLRPIRGSKGTLPKNLSPISLASRSPPPVVGLKILDSPPQFGHTNPDIFSTIPSTFTPAFRQKSISLRTSNNATSCGVVTINAPSIPASFM